MAVNPMILDIVAAAYELHLRRIGPRSLLITSRKRLAKACAKISTELLAQYGITVQTQQETSNAIVVHGDDSSPISRL